MKKFFVSLSALLAVISCTEKLPVTPEPSVENQGICQVKVTIQDTTWSALNSRLGVYSSTGTNSEWRLRSMYDGRTGVAEFFGEAATGSVYAYYPYSSAGYAPCADGRVYVPAEQKWCESFAAHMKYNNPYMVAALCNGAFLFNENLGAIHVKLDMDCSENVQYVVLSASTEYISGNYDITGKAYERMTQGSNSIKIYGIDKPTTRSAPLDVWIMLPPGTYNGLCLIVAGTNEFKNSVIYGDLTIAAGAQTDLDAKAECNSYEGSDFEGETVEFDKAE